MERIMPKCCKTVIFAVMSILTFTVTSCDTYKKINYLQDVVPDKAERIAINKGILIQPKDMISIVVKT